MPLTVVKWYLQSSMMTLLMKPQCEKCTNSLASTDPAYICSYECTFCEKCATQMKYICPNCGGELVARPKRKI
jgi:uncharacterized protein